MELVEPAGGFGGNGAEEELGDPGLPGVVSGALGAHPVAAEGPSRGLPESQGRLADRVPQHVVLGGDRGVRAAAVRGCAVRRGGCRDRHPAAGNAFVTTLRWLLTGRRESFLWFERAGVGPAELDRVAGVGRRIAERDCSQDAAPIVPALAAADLLAGRLFPEMGRDGEVGASDSARWRRPRAWQRSCSAWQPASWPVCR